MKELVSSLPMFLVIGLLTLLLPKSAKKPFPILMTGLTFIAGVLPFGVFVPHVMANDSFALALRTLVPAAAAWMVGARQVAGRPKWRSGIDLIAAVAWMLGISAVYAHQYAAYREILDLWALRATSDTEVPGVNAHVAWIALVAIAATAAAVWRTATKPPTAFSPQ